MIISYCSFKTAYKDSLEQHLSNVHGYGPTKIKTTPRRSSKKATLEQAQTFTFEQAGGGTGTAKLTVLQEDGTELAVDTDMSVITVGETVIVGDVIQAGDHVIQAGDHVIQAGDHHVIQAGDHVIQAGDHVIQAGDHVIQVWPLTQFLVVVFVNIVNIYLKIAIAIICVDGKSRPPIGKDLVSFVPSSNTCIGLRTSKDSLSRYVALQGPSSLTPALLPVQYCRSTATLSGDVAF